MNKEKHRFEEVDEDLRRIGEREATKEWCKYGNNCYRKDPNHLRDFRHRRDSGSDNRGKQLDTNAVKRGKITDYFNRKPTPKKFVIEKPTDVSDYEIEDTSEDEVNNTSINRSKTSHSSKTPSKTPSKRRQINPKSKAVKTSRQTKTNDSDCDNDFDKELKLLIKDDNSVSEPKIKRMNFNDLSCSSAQKSMKFDETFVAKDEYKAMISKMSQKELNEVLKEIFLVEMPKDFFNLWQFCRSIKPERPEDAFVESLGLRLVGPYDVLSGKVKKSSIEDKEQILCHWRYFYDLPEFQTTIASVKSSYHLGYFRDTPEEDNPVVVSNDSDKSCVIEGMADNVCAAISTLIQKNKSKTPSKTLTELEMKFKEFCNKNKINFNEKSKLMDRKSKIAAKTFNGFGFVVPINKKTEVGYRPLPMTDSDLKRLFNSIVKVDEEVRDESKSLSELKHVIQLVGFATDECDFGMGLELGIDLFAFGHQFFHKSVLFLLPQAYGLLKREPFARIIKAHINNRRNGFDLSCV